VKAVLREERLKAFVGTFADQRLARHLQLGPLGNQKPLNYLDKAKWDGWEPTFTVKKNVFVNE